jgi:CRISPR-associated endonuclease/helicase Cas3
MLKRGEPFFRWDYLSGRWEMADEDDLRPGLMILVHPASGGYDPQLGFTGAAPKKGKPVPEVEHAAIGLDELPDRSESNEASSAADVWKTIATHGRDAEYVGIELVGKLGLANSFGKLISLALRLHDWGKAHPAFAGGTYRVSPARTDLAKAPNSAWRARQELYDTTTHGPRRGFRHELVSSLAVLELLRGINPSHPAILGNVTEMLKKCGFEPELRPAEWSDHPIASELSAIEFNLLLYLIASHHGKVRVSMQASPRDQEFPFEEPEFVGTGLPIRGVREEDLLPPVLLSATDDHSEMPRLQLSLAPASMGCRLDMEPVGPNGCNRWWITSVPSRSAISKRSYVPVTAARRMIEPHRDGTPIRC